MFTKFQCIFVLNKFYENYSPQELYTTLKGFLIHQRRVELKDLYKEVNNTTATNNNQTHKTLNCRNSSNSCDKNNDSISANSWQLYDYTLSNRQHTPYHVQYQSPQSRVFEYNIPPSTSRCHFDRSERRREPDYYYQTYSDPYGYFYYH